MNFLTLEHVTKTYGEKTLFQDIGVTINKGDKIALVAKNGSGKTTLLRVIAGEETGEGEQCSILLRKDIKVGFAFDMDISTAVLGSNNVGGFELCASYMGKIYKKPKPKPVIFCPRL